MKKRFFTIICVILAALVPMPVFAVYSDLTQAQADYYYALYMILGTVLFLVVSAGMFVYWRHLVSMDRRFTKQKMNKKTSVNAPEKEIFNWVLLIIGIGLFARLAAAIPSPGFANDVALFKYWGSTAADDFLNTYNTLGSNIDYPPGYVYILATCGFLGKIFGGTGSAFYTLIIKLPAILSDCGISLFIYKICKGKVPSGWIYFFVAFWMANPLSFLDSTVWGQVDAVLTFALVAALYLITRERYVLSAVVFGVAVMLKPQAIIVLPVLCFALFKNKKIKTFILSALAGIGTAIGVALPFALSVDMTTEHMQETVTPVLELLHADGGGILTDIVTPFAWILSLFMGTAGHYDYASVNALNFFFALDGNWVKDSEPLLGLSWFIWGMIFIVLAAALTWFLYIKTKKSHSLPFMAAAVILLLVANFGPRMHERYFFPAVVFLFIAAILKNNKWLLGVAVGASVFGYFTVLEILVDLNLGIPYMWPGISFIRLILSWGNVIVSLVTAVFAIADSFGKIEGTGFNKKIWRQ